MLTASEKNRRQKISKTMKKIRASTHPPWNKGKIGIKTSDVGKTPWNKGTKGLMGFRSNHPNWRGGRNITKFGYIRIYIPEHPYASTNGYILEHRYIMEQHIGRYLKPKEHIHHINGIKDDNRYENMKIISNAQHNKIHFPHGFNPKRNKI